MQEPDNSNDLDNWRFERRYINLFSILVEKGLPDEEWRYDPLDSKYPTVDGILRRERKLPAGNGDQETKYNPTAEFALLQLKGTRFTQSESSWDKLKKLFSKRRDGGSNATEEVNSIASSCPALLIGLSVDVSSNSSRIEAAYIGAPEGIPTDRKPEKRIEPDDLVKSIAAVLDALRPLKQPVDVPITPLVPEIKQIIFPRPKELVYFNKQQNGTLSVGESGIIFGRNISVNWTIPRGIKMISVSTISGSPEIWAVAVALPGPPYDTYRGREEKITEQEWCVKPNLPGIADKDLWWVFQVHFKNGEATIKVEAHA
jgi:hypothetical protein